MELPILNFPMYVEELSEPFHSLFKQKRQLLQFKRLITGFGIAEKHTIAHMNGLFTNHTNQSNLNRFITNSDWDQSEMNRIKMCMINKIEKDGIVILDDYIVEKSGKEIFGTDWHRDHPKVEISGAIKLRIACIRKMVSIHCYQRCISRKKVNG